MSRNIRIALGRGHAYLQSPIDDLESFYHVFVWAILHNIHWQSFLTGPEEEYRDKLSGSWEYRDAAQTQLRKPTSSQVLGSDLRELLKAWKSTQNYLEDKWEKIQQMPKDPRIMAHFKKNNATEQEFRKWSWHLIAFEGVHRILMDICKAMISMHSEPV